MLELLGQSSLKFFLHVWKSWGRRPECWKSQVITFLVEILGSEFSQVGSFEVFTCSVEIQGVETGVLEVPGHHMSCWNHWFFLRIWKSRGRRPETRSSHVLLKSLGQSSLKFWVFFTCLVETQGAETGVLWTQLGVSRLFTIGRKSWGQRLEMKINIFLGKRWDRLACSAVVIAQLDDLCIVFWASVFHNPSKWNIVQQCTRSAVDFERWHSYNNNINRAGKHWNIQRNKSAVNARTKLFAVAGGQVIEIQPARKV